MNVFQKSKAALERRKLWELFSYVFFGGLTTGINLLVHLICFSLFHWHYLVATVIAWFASVFFAFFTNKKWVFQANHTTNQAALLELMKFIFYRLLSLVLDAGCMWLMIETLHVNNWLAKIVTQVVVVVANFFFSKFLIFGSSGNRK